MAEALIKMFDTMTAIEQKELYDFALFIISQRKEKKNPLEDFCGVISNEDAQIMMDAVEECRRIEPDEW